MSDQLNYGYNIQMNSTKKKTRRNTLMIDIREILSQQTNHMILSVVTLNDESIAIVIQYGRCIFFFFFLRSQHTVRFSSFAYNLLICFSI